MGGIAGINASTGTILRCGVEGSVKGGKRTGGIAGSNLGMIRDCTNESYINTTSADKALTPDDIEINLVLDISALNSTDTKTTATDTGGIAGYSSGIIGRCRNTGGVGYPHVGYNVGGITGRSCGYIYDSRNSGIICGRKDIGGICGQMEPYIAANMTETTLAKLQRQLDELDGLLDQAAEDAGDGMSTVTSRLNKMAGNVSGASSGLKDIQTSATIDGSAAGSGDSGGSGSITFDPSGVTVGGSSDGSGGQISVDISGGGAEGGGSSSVSGNVSASTQITMTTSLSGVASSLSGLASQMRMLSGEMAGMSAELQSDVLAINEKVNEITDTAYDLLYREEDDLIVDSSAIAPGVKELDVRFGEGLAQVTLEDGRIQRLTFQVDGSAAVAMVDVPVSFTAQFTIPNTPEQFVIPEAVRSALER